MTRNLVFEADPVVFITALVYAPTITGSEGVVDKATKRAALDRDNKHCCKKSTQNVTQNGFMKTFINKTNNIDFLLAILQKEN